MEEEEEEGGRGTWALLLLDPPPNQKRRGKGIGTLEGPPLSYITQKCEESLDSILTLPKSDPNRTEIVVEWKWEKLPFFLEYTF